MHVHRKTCDFCNKPAVMHGTVMVNKDVYLCEEHARFYGVFDTAKILCEPVLVTQVCSICGKAKSIADFYSYTDHSGVKRRRTECKECNHAGRKISALKKVKKSMEVVKCQK